MKTKMMIGLMLLVLGSLAYPRQNTAEIPKLTGPYLGQKPPGKTPEPFAPGFFGDKYRAYHSNIVFSPDGTELYWHGILNDQSRLQGIWESKLVSGVWTDPKLASFSKLVPSPGMDDAPKFSPDGQKIFFTSSRPIEKGGPSEKTNIWFVERTEAGWGEAKPLPPIVNALRGIHWCLSVDPTGTLYFGVWRNNNGVMVGEIYCAEYVDGHYLKPAPLGPEINKENTYNYSPCLGPGGRYLIFNREDGGFSTLCSFRKKDGGWTEARNISDVIGYKMEKCPIVTHDGRFLLLFVGKPSPYWMEASFIEELRKSELKEKES